MEPLDYPIAGSISTVPTFVKPADGSYKVRVVNTSPSDLWLKPHSVIGRVSEVDSVDKDSPVDFRQLSKDEVVVELRPYHSPQSQVENNLIIGESDEKHADSEKRRIKCLELSGYEKQRLEKVQRKNIDVVALDEDDLGCTQSAEFIIHLKDKKPVNQPYGRIHPSQFQEAKEHVKYVIHHKLFFLNYYTMCSTPF